ncbi:vWA domain-containing protein [Treponema pectinovorum]|uniref:vWA domain-containing protein n=1 Tax=Treponema pectinovorum TaxID=164 RepID=UPI0011CB4A09|nr:vWA domain-containing protein [Treponema pectinovorum]
MKRFLFSSFIAVFSIYSFFAQSPIFAEKKPLLITPDDIRLVYDEGKTFENSQGYNLYIRKKSGIESVMLTETTKDYSGNSANYAYRAKTYNAINGDEKRYLNGKPLESSYSKYSLIDSSVEADSEFGECFHIYIPSELEYGYPWSRNGTVKIGRGTFINIRAFEKKYGDYTGAFLDNPFMFDLGKVQKTAPKKQETQIKTEQPQKTLPLQKTPVVEKLPEPTPVIEEIADFEEPIVLTDDYNPLAASSFSDIANFNGGVMCFSKGPQSIVDDIMKSLNRITKKDSVDIVFAIDATGSMKDDVQKLREEWIPRLTQNLKTYKSVRIALLLYRDYNDTFRYMGLPVKRYEFCDSVEAFNKNLNDFIIYGNEGGDIPEAVYEALYASLNFYKWRKNAYKKIILIGDAEPHPTPRGTGKYTKQLVATLAQKKNVVIDAIIVPDDKSLRGR